MERIEKIKKLNRFLLMDLSEYEQEAAQLPGDPESQRRLLRSLMNVRYPKGELNSEFLCLQDELLSEEREEKGVVNVVELPR